MKRNFIISTIIFLLLAGVACAGDSLSLSISCTIPAIPGLNVPLIEEETLKTQEDADTAIQQKVEPDKESHKQSPEMLQEDTQEKKELDKSRKSVVMVKTIYSR